MRLFKLPIAILLSVFAAVSARADMMSTGVGSGNAGSVAPPAGVVFTPTYASCENSGGASPYTFTGVTVGTGLSVVSVYETDNRVATSILIQGGGGTAIAATSNLSMWQGATTAGSASIQVTLNAGSAGMCISVGYLTGATATPTCAGSCPVLNGSVSAQPFVLGGALTVPANGRGVVAMGSALYSGTSLPLNWNSATREAITEDEIGGVGNGAVTGMGSLTSSGTPQVSCAGANCNYAGVSMIGATWGP